MNKSSTILPTYHDILSDKNTAQYLQTQCIKTEYKSTDTLENLWKNHDNTLISGTINTTVQTPNLLDLKITIAEKIYEHCHFCVHNCQINRHIHVGKCRVKHTKIASEFIHMGEELIFIPSYTIFFSGCSMQCVFCQNSDISQSNSGLIVQPHQMADAIHDKGSQYIRNINWVGGDPTPHLVFILNVLKNCSKNIPQIWNSNMYCSMETMKLLHGIIDVYLTDFKFGNDSCARRLAKIPRYMTTIQQNHIGANKNGEVLIRHLVLPHHSECCSYPILHWIHDHLPDTPINIMDQYRPSYQSKQYEDINTSLQHAEYEKVCSKARELQLKIV